MLNVVERSTGAKVGGCAVTYRAGGGDMFGTCPVSCALNPSGSGSGSTRWLGLVVYSFQPEAVGGS